MDDETGTGVLVFGTAPVITTSISQDGDVSDAGYLRLQNAAQIAWEASPAGTDYTLAVDASEILQASGAFTVAGAFTSSGTVPHYLPATAGLVMGVTTVDVAGAGQTAAPVLFTLANNTVEANGFAGISAKDNRTGTEADAENEAGLMLDSAGTYAFNVAVGRSVFNTSTEFDGIVDVDSPATAGSVFTIDTVDVAGAGQTSYAIYIKAANNTVEANGWAFAFIEDDRTGTEADSTTEASFVIDAEGTFAIDVAKGDVNFDDDVVFTETGGAAGTADFIVAGFSEHDGPLHLDDTSLQFGEGADTMTITVPALTAARAVTFADAAGEVSLLGQTIAAGEIVDITRSVNIPIGGMQNTTAGQAINWSAGVDTEPDFVNTNGVLTIAYDAVGGSVDSNGCTDVFMVPPDYVSGGTIAVRVTQSGATVANIESIGVVWSLDGAAASAEATTNLANQTAVQTVTVTPAGAPVAGTSVGLVFRQANAAADDTVFIHAIEFRYTATQ